MDRRVRIPVNVRGGAPEAVREPRPSVADARAAVSGAEDEETYAAPARPGPADSQPGGPEGSGREAGMQSAVQAPPPGSEQGGEWRDRALRLQAEMENFRKRQQRLAQDQIESERQRLLRSFLPVVDDLERALASPSRDGQGLREGVELTRRAALQLLQREGVERVQDLDVPFDPNWHEAVTTVDHREVGVSPNTVVQVLEPGYRLRDQLLRPARVVVAL